MLWSQWGNLNDQISLYLCVGWYCHDNVFDPDPKIIFFVISRFCHKNMIRLESMCIQTLEAWDETKALSWVLLHTARVTPPPKENQTKIQENLEKLKDHRDASVYFWGILIWEEKENSHRSMWTCRRWRECCLSESQLALENIGILNLKNKQESKAKNEIK